MAFGTFCAWHVIIKRTCSGPEVDGTRLPNLLDRHYWGKDCGVVLLVPDQVSDLRADDKVKFNFGYLPRCLTCGVSHSHLPTRHVHADSFH